jgi:hypothetical protein
MIEVGVDPDGMQRQVGCLLNDRPAQTFQYS